MPMPILDASELQMFLSTVERFVDDRLVPLADMVEEADDVDERGIAELRAQASGLGLYAYNLDRSLGGAGLSYGAQCEVARILGRVPMALRRVVARLPESLSFATPAQRDWFVDPVVSAEKVVAYALTEPNAGSDLGGISTRAHRAGAEWVLSGEKQFISHPDTADFTIVLAVTDPSAPLAKRFTTFIVRLDDPGFDVTPRLRLMGWRGYHLAGFHLDSCRVPADRVLGDVGNGFKVMMSSVNSTRLNLAAECVGMAEVALRASAQQAAVRMTFGRPLGEHQAIQFMLADAAIDVDAGWLLTKYAAGIGDVPSSAGQSFRVAASKAKLFATEALGRVVDTAVQIHGAGGVTKDLPIERWYRDARLHRIGEGTSEMQRIQIGRDLLKRMGAADQ